MGAQRRTLTRTSWSDIAATCDRRTVSGRRDKAMILLMYRLGLRAGELVHARLDDLDLEDMRFRVPPEGKTGVRLLGIPDSHELVSALADWLDVREGISGGGSPYLFCTRGGGRVDTSHVRRMVARRGKKAGIDGRIHPHMARHSFASEQVRREGVAVTDVQSMLGHRHASTTAIYLHALDDRHIDIMQTEMG